MTAVPSIITDLRERAVKEQRQLAEISAKRQRLDKAERERRQCIEKINLQLAELANTAPVPSNHHDH